MGAGDFLAAFFGGMFVGCIVGIMVVFFGAGSVMNNLQIKEVNVDINETRIIQTMMQEMDKRGYLRQYNFTNESYIWYNSSFNTSSFGSDCCYPIECQGLFEAPRKNCTCTYPVHCFTVYETYNKSG